MKKNMEKLNKHFFPLLVVALLLICSCLPIRVNAAVPVAPIDYTKLDYSVRYGTYENEVTIPVSSDFFYFNYIDEGSGVNYPFGRGEDSYTFVVQPNRLYSLFVYPFSNFGISLKNVPVGAQLIFDMRIDLSSPAGSPFQSANINRRGFYLDRSSNWILPVMNEPTDFYFGEDFTVSYLIEDKPDAVSFVPSISIKQFKTLETIATTFTVTLRNVRLVMNVPVAYWEQFQAEQNGKLLGDIKDAIEDSTDQIVDGTPEQNQAADDFAESMDSAIGDLESAGDSLNQVGTPEVDVNGLIPDDVLLGESYLNYVTAIQSFWDCEILAKILTFLGFLILISVVFFGLRG